MRPLAYYNENDPKAAAWLKELITHELIADGIVDTRSILDVRPQDLAGFTQHHFFAGIGGWSAALRLAGWPDSELVWTASCPCQPFSQSGKRLGEKDERHLWPVLRELVACRQPAIAFGEQVASPLGREWFAGVRDDLEGLGYEVGGADLCAASVGAPHIRQRIYWMANAQFNAREPGRASDQPGESNGAPQERTHTQSGRCGNTGGLVQPNSAGSQPGREAAEAAGYGRPIEPASGGIGGLGDAEGKREGAVSGGSREEICELNGDGRLDHSESDGRKVRPHLHGELRGQGLGEGRESGHWSDYQLVPCLDGKTRRVKSGIQCLADGVPARVVRLRGYGNAIVPQLAAEFIQAAVEALRL